MVMLAWLMERPILVWQLMLAYAGFALVVVVGGVWWALLTEARLRRRRS